MAQSQRRIDLAIRVNRLVKEYRIYPRPLDVLVELLTGKDRHTRFRALDEVSFDVVPGEVVGVIGRNGAGKSTLLKVLTGVIDHDSGSVEINGRVSAILELGTGINAEYSGRDNIIFGGLCRGMSKREILEKLDSVIEFSELGNVIDQPFKTYSSGMQSRLLFSIAMSTDANILIVDEALAAGDALFQEKCFSRMKALASSGKTIFFVSHSINLIQQLCTRGLLLDHGRILVDGDTALVLHEYDEILARARAKNMIQEPSYVMGSGEEERPDLKAYIKTVDIVDATGQKHSTLSAGKVYSVRQTVVFNDNVPHAIVGFRLHLPSGLVIYSLQNTLRNFGIKANAGDILDIYFSFTCSLQAGQYLLSVGVGEVLDASQGLHPAPFNEIHIRNNIHMIHVVTDSLHGGLVDFSADIRVERQDTCLG